MNYPILDDDNIHPNKRHNPLLIFFRWIIFIPISALVIGLIQFGLSALITLVFIDWGIADWVQILIIILFAFGIWGFFKFISAVISGLTIKICPNILIGSIVFGILTVAGFIWLIIDIWRNNDAFWACIILTALALSLMSALLRSASFMYNHTKHGYAEF